ncbi:MAG: phytanoyl-CoA dioxygenase family protein [Proteobacteria bacterium]|nr:phytanoyl-CoA dioxygenase family protein [Pseudomonadota bacterium]MDA1022961.1 phytanoyl-CoA dioxygenase family protein [Pseudomonadota bacterium]
MLLTDPQIRQFQDLGYAFPLPVLEPGEVATLRDRLQTFEAGQGGRLKPEQRSKCHLLFKWVDDLIRDARILDAVEQLIGPDILCWNTIFWIKEAGSESFVSWHQDTRYWGLSSDKVVTAWLALSDAGINSGCMRVMPGTHAGDVLEHEDRYHQDNMLTRGQEISGGLDETKAVPMPLGAGEMSIHNYRLAHASGPNTSDDRRIGLSMHFMPPETKQIVGPWDCAALVRGQDDYGHFEATPVPSCDFDDAAVAFHAKAAEALRQVLYVDAEQNTQKV